MANGPLNFILPIVVPLLFMGGLLYLTWRQSRRLRTVWSAFAARRDWGFTASGKISGVMELQGQHQGHELSLLTEGRGSGTRRYDVTVLRMDLSDTVPRQLALTPEDRLFKFFGGKDAELGDVELDAALELQGVTPEARALLQVPRVRQSLMGVVKSYERFTLEEGLLEAVHRGIPKKAEALEAVLAPALALVEALDEAAGQARERRA